MYHTFTTGVECIDPTNRALRANGQQAPIGFANIPELEVEVAAWYDAKSFDEEKAVVRRINKTALDQGVYAPVGWYLMNQAWRKNVSGIGQGPLPFFWGVGKAA